MGPRVSGMWHQSSCKWRLRCLYVSSCQAKFGYGFLTYFDLGCHDVDWLNETTFAACSTNASVHLVSLSSNQVFRTLMYDILAFLILLNFPIIIYFSGHSKSVNQVKFNKQGTMLASCSDDHTACIWFKEAWTDINGFIATGGNELNESPNITLFGHTKQVIDIQWCPCRDGTAEKLLATYVQIFPLLS